MSDEIKNNQELENKEIVEEKVTEIRGEEKAEEEKEEKKAESTDVRSLGLFPEFLHERLNIIHETFNKTFSKIDKEARENIKKIKELGEQAHEDGKKVLSSFLEKTKLSKEEIEKRIDEGVAKIIASLNIPQKKDIEDLNKRLDNISKKLDELNK